MPNVESFLRGELRSAISATQSVPFTLSVSSLPTLDNQYLTVDGDTDSEEILYFTTRVGTAGGPGTVNVTGRGYNSYNSTQDAANYKPHAVNAKYVGAVNHIVLNQKAGLTEENAFTELIVPPTFADDAAADASWTGGTAPNGASFYSTAGGAVRIKNSGVWTNSTGAADFAQTRAVAVGSSGAGELFRDTGSSNDLSYKDHGGTVRNLLVNATGKIDANRYDFSADTAGTETTKPVNSTFVSDRLDVAVGKFGNGSDGSVTINSGTTTLVRDMYYENLTVTSPGVLNPNGYRIFVRGTLSGNGTIRRNGNNGAAGSSGAAPSAAGGAALNQGTLSADLGGGASGTAGGTNGAAANPSYTAINGVSGGTASNFSGQKAPGTGGTSVRGANYSTYLTAAEVYAYLFNPATTSPYSTTKYLGASASGGGGADWVPSSGACGGGGGGNGGLIWICARIVNFTGTFEAIGGTGGAGGAGGSNYGGGGGGGQGGVVVVIVKTATATGTKTLTGGTGGASGGGTATAGANGNAGVYIEIAA